MRTVIIISGLILLVFFSCKKSKVTPAKPSIVGYWMGTTSLSASPTMAVIYRANGTARIFTTVQPLLLDTNAGTTVKSEGAYYLNLKGDSISAYFPAALNFIFGLNYNGSINMQKTDMSGPIQIYNISEYGGNISSNPPGTFELTKDH
jgi:hypothetical protein